MECLLVFPNYVGDRPSSLNQMQLNSILHGATAIKSSTQLLGITDILRVMPPDMAISMRHTKLKAEEAALLAGEINKPTWESRNEGIHERISFEDTIWGFDLAGGVYYRTPLRVTFVKPDSRAEKAGIRLGDRLLRINDMDTSTLTIQQAHDIIVESGIHLKLSVTSPDDYEDSYYCYEDPLVEDGYDSEEERRIEEEKAKKRRVCARVSHYWSLQWPWVSKRRLIYRESNCFMVPSKYEDARRDKYPPLPSQRYTDDIILYNADENEENKKRTPSLQEIKQRTRNSRQERLANGNAANDVIGDLDSNMSDDEEPAKLVKSDKKTFDSKLKSRRSSLKVERQETIEEYRDEEEENSIMQEEVNGELKEEVDEEANEVKNDGNNEEGDIAVKEVNENNNDILNPIPEMNEEINQATEEGSLEVDNVIENDNVDEVNGDVNGEDVINEVLGKPDSASRSDEDSNILDSILSDEGQNLENSESNNER